jgi:nucleoside-diphosphate-sugar epimerase
MCARIAIVGCGYLGAALGAVLAREGHDCLGTTTTPQRADEIGRLGVRPAVVRLDEIDRLRELLADREVAYLTMAPGRRRQPAPSAYRAVYVDGVRAILEAGAGSSIRKYVYTSSTRVYGQDDGGLVDESSPTDPPDEDGRILVQAERLLLDGAARWDATATVLRLGGIWGPDRDPAERVLVLAGTEQSGGEAYVNLVHRDDAVAALRACLTSDYHGVLNCVGGAAITRRELYDRLLSAAGCQAIRWTTPGAGRRGKRVRNDEIRRLLGGELRFRAV